MIGKTVDEISVAIAEQITVERTLTPYSRKQRTLTPSSRKCCNARSSAQPRASHMDASLLRPPRKLHLPSGGKRSHAMFVKSAC
jgi:hypothetical protein